MNITDHQDIYYQNLASREQVVKLKLEARMLSGLYERLLTMKTVSLAGRYRIRSLLDVGGQGIVYVAEDIRYQMPVLIKMPFLPYHNPGYINLEQIRQARNMIWQEARLLAHFSGTILPEFYDCFEDNNPLHHRAWGAKVYNFERYLVMEFILGQTLEEVIAQYHSLARYHDLERLAWEIAEQVINLCEVMWLKRLLYTDLRPANIMLADSRDQRGQPQWKRRGSLSEHSLLPCKTNTPVRLIDASSIVRLQDKMQEYPYHPSYILPSYYQKSIEGELLPPNHKFVIYTLGKTLFQLITNREPLPGRDPNWQEPILKYYSPAFRGLLRIMIEGQVSTLTHLKTALVASLVPA